MYDFFIQNQQYIVLTIVLIIWIGLFLLLSRLNNKLNQIEKFLESMNFSHKNNWGKK